MLIIIILHVETILSIFKDIFHNAWFTLNSFEFIIVLYILPIFINIFHYA